MNRTSIAILFCLLSAAAAAAEVSGVQLADSAQASGGNLVLNGAGLRTKAGLFSVYVIGLYLPGKTQDAQSVINARQARRITIVMKRDVAGSTLLNAFHEGLEANLSPQELQALKPKLYQLDTIFGEFKEVKEKDIINLDFGADGSTQISVNGQPKDAIPGADLSSALLKIWLGQNPVQADLKQKLLKG